MLKILNRLNFFIGFALGWSIGCIILHKFGIVDVLVTGINLIAGIIASYWSYKKENQLERCLF